MSTREMWKMLHLLNLYGPELSRQQLFQAGVDCYMDTIDPLSQGGAVCRPTPETFSLSAPAVKLLEVCVLVPKRGAAVDMRVDFPQAFVIMPFSESWSADVYREVIEPAVKTAGLECLRGDTIARDAALSDNILSAIMRAGMVIADVSAGNMNVYYEVGLAHALGKDPLFIKQKGTTLPADFGGIHYTEYDLTNLSAGRDLLQGEIERWVEKYRMKGVKELYH